MGGLAQTDMGEYEETRMNGKRRRIQGLTLVLCAALLGLNLWQGQQIKDLRQKVQNAPEPVADISGLSEECAGQPEAAEEAPDFAWAECAHVDPAARTMTLRIYLERPNAGDAYSVNVRYGTGGQSSAVSLRRLPGGALGGEFTLPLEVGGGIEITQSNGTVLFCRDSLTDMLPVQLAAYPDLLVAEGRADLRECRIELTDPQGGWAEVTEAAFRVDWNGEAIFERACGTILRGPVELETWTHPFAKGDALECHFLCTDRYGLRYDFILCKMPVGELVDNQERYRPVLIWPEE